MELASEFTDCLNDCDNNRIFSTTARELNISATSDGSKKPRSRKNQECENKRKIYVITGNYEIMQI